jgi:hypothetical protein
LQFSFFVFRLPDPLFKGNANAAHRSGRGHNAGLVEARPEQRERFFEAFVSAALRLDRVAMRDWLRKRLRNRPLVAPVDPTRFIFADADLAALLKTLPLRAADDADRGTGL